MNTRGQVGGFAIEGTVTLCFFTEGYDRRVQVTRRDKTILPPTKYLKMVAYVSRNCPSSLETTAFKTGLAGRKELI